VIVAVRTVGAFQENCYLVIDEVTREAVLVDPGAEPELLLAWLAEEDVRLTAIWCTHGHLDHIGGIAGVTRVHDVPVHLHPADRPVYDYAPRSAAAYGLPFEPAPPPDVDLAEGDVLTVGAQRFTVWHVPGHSPGHVLFVGDDCVLGGDLLFAGSIGRVDLPLSDPAAMQRSLDRLAALPDRLTVFPGHGEPTTLEAERGSNPFLRGGARLISR
jgi:hydroxyacylglutathione hydrolase